MLTNSLCETYDIKGYTRQLNKKKIYEEKYSRSIQHTLLESLEGSIDRSEHQEYLVSVVE